MTLPHARDSAKGTLYLYFDDKEQLFEEVLRSAVSPVLERLSALATASDMPVDRVLDGLFSVFESEVLGTKRKFLIRLIIAEGPRFPRIAEFYYRNVVARIMPLIAKVAERAVKRSEFSTDAYAAIRSSSPRRCCLQSSGMRCSQHSSHST